MKTCAECILCLLNSDNATLPPTASDEEKATYQREVLRMIADSDPQLCTVQLSTRIDAIFHKYFGERRQKNFAELKRVYNERMLLLEPHLQTLIDIAVDPLACATKLARLGNYIDFGAKHEVDDALLAKLLAGAEQETLDADEYEHFRRELTKAQSVVYITDNAGEIVLDKMLLKVMMARYPNTAFTVLVRGAPTLNDATLDNAHAVGLAALLPVVGNGNNLPGTVWDEISNESKVLINSADVIIAKGQANFETLCGCGLNIYFLLLCKCDYFVHRFQVPKLTGLFVNERRLPSMRA